MTPFPAVFSVARTIGENDSTFPAVAEASGANLAGGLSVTLKFPDESSKSQVASPPISDVRSTTYRQLLNNSEDAGRFSFSISLRRLFSLSSRSPRASPETSQSRSGMRRPAGVARNHAPGRRPATPPSATTSGRGMRQRDRRAPPAVQRPTVSPGGPGAKNRRGGAPRGERPAGRSGLRSGSRASSRAMRLRAYVTGPRRVPLHPSACRRSAPSPCVRGKQQTSEA